MYISTRQWRDLTDGYLYNAGERYPHDGREIPEKRINELSTTQNRAGFALIKEVEEPKEAKPVKETATPKKAVRSRKKAV